MNKFHSLSEIAILNTFNLLNPKLIKNATINSLIVEFNSVELSSCCWKQSIENLKNGFTIHDVVQAGH